MKRMPALGRKLPHAGEVSSNPRPHQKKGGRKLSELVKQSLLPRQDYFELIPSRSNNLQPVRGRPSRS
jgi:hypothetical protein